MKRAEITRVIALMLVLTLTAVMLCGCETYDNFKKAFIDPPTQEKLVIKIGIFEPLTGRQSYDAEDELLGMQIAYEMFPSVLGYDIELVYKDNRSSTDEAKEAVKALIDRGCVGILGSNSASLSLAVSDIIKEAKIPAITATNTVPILTSTNDYYFRVCYTNSYDAQGAAHYILEGIKDDSGEVGNITRAAVLVAQNNDFALGKAELFRNEFLTQLGIDPETVNDDSSPAAIELDENGNPIPVINNVEIFTLPTEDTEIIPMLDKVAATLGNDTAIYFPSDIETAVNVISKAALAGYDFTWIGTESWEGIESYNTEIESFERSELLRNLAQTENRNTLTSLSANTNTTLSSVDNPSEIHESPDETIPAGPRMLLDKTVYTIDYDSTEKQSEMPFRFNLYYRDKVGADAIPSENVALGFDAYMLLYRAIESIEKIEADTESENSTQNFDDTDITEYTLFDSEGKLNGNVLATAIYGISEMDGATGKISINADGDPIKDIYIKGIIGGEVKTVYKARPNEE